MSNGLEEKAVELLDKLDTLATKYTPEVLDGALSAISLNGLSMLMNGVFLVALSVVLVYAAVKAKNFCMDKHKEEGRLSDWDVVGTIAIVFGGPTSVVSMVFGVVHLLTIWNWVAVFNPKLALIHRLLGL